MVRHLGILAIHQGICIVMPRVIKGSSLTLGQNNHCVLETILGYSRVRIAELVIEGALEY